MARSVTRSRARMVIATLVNTTVTYELYAFDAAGNVSDAATLMVTP